MLYRVGNHKHAEHQTKDSEVVQELGQPVATQSKTDEVSSCRTDGDAGKHHLCEREQG